MTERRAHPPVESTLPKPWEQQAGFHDLLYDWTTRAPWLALSLAAHLLAFFVLMAIPWEHLRREDVRTIQATIDVPPETLAPEPPEEPEEVVVDEERLEEPVLRPADAEEASEDELDLPLEPSDVPAEALAPFEPAAMQDVLGIGGSRGGGDKLAGRLGGPGGRPGGRDVAETIERGLAWLAAHQGGDGSWDADGFAARCGALGASRCEGPGDPTHDVGVTGLALLAFLGQGSTTAEGPYRDVVASGVAWLRARQDPDTGRIGDAVGHAFLYDHAIATLALCEAYYFGRSPLVKRSAQAAVGYVERARDPYLAWRYDVPSIGQSDTSVTGWMLFALVSAREAGLSVSQAALDGGLAWIEQVTDPATGRVGYDRLGSLSSRTPANDRYPREKGEAMTAVGLLCRIFLGQDPADEPGLARGAELLVRTPPAWEPEALGCDMYYWYYGTYAAYQLGGRHWRAWEAAMKDAMLPSQETDGDERGSWDPVGPWGYAGGRVYSTALMVLCLQVYYRYARVLGAR